MIMIRSNKRHITGSDGRLKVGGHRRGRSSKIDKARSKCERERAW
jgi:hypothetical protein